MIVHIATLVSLVFITIFTFKTMRATHDNREAIEELTDVIAPRMQQLLDKTEKVATTEATATEKIRAADVAKEITESALENTIVLVPKEALTRKENAVENS